jgi:hypothetical protein
LSRHRRVAPACLTLRWRIRSDDNAHLVDYVLGQDLQIGKADRSLQPSHRSIMPYRQK